MKYDYLNKKNWSEITRDERTFCMYLFSAFRDNPDKLVELIRKTVSPHIGFINNLPVEGKKWELGYEVCFYRDLLCSYGYKVKGNAKEIKAKTEIEDTTKLIKRTFDLCLFSEKEIIIIEAKSHEPFSSKQFQDFENDEFYIQEIFKFLKVKNPPKVYFVVLASSKYYSSPSFSLKNGVAKRFLLEMKVTDSLLSWKQIATDKYFGDSFQTEKKLLLRADEIYGQ